jgi:hypothetical protein
VKLVRRLWGAPLWAHLLALLIVLLAITWWVGTDASFSIDEPAAIAQGQRLANGDGWQLPEALPSIDPSGRWPYIVRSDTGPEGVVIYGKHPLYPLVLAVADRADGQAGMVVVSVLGALAASLVGALLARRLDASLDRPTLWLLGLGSPLLFDSQIVIAHTLGAACTGGAALAVAVLLDRWCWRWTLVAVVLAGLACSLRTEAIVFAIALAIYAGFRALADRSWRWAATAVGLLGTAGAAALIDRLVLGHLIGAVTTVYDTGPESSSFLEGRISALTTMLVAPGESWPYATLVALTGTMVVAAALGLVLRLRPGGTLLGRVAAAAMVAGAVIPLLGYRMGIVPGLLAAVPALIVGLLVIDRVVLRPPLARMLAAVTGVFAFGIALSQYSHGGGIEWGARFVALALPLLAPLVVWSFWCAQQRIGREVTGPAIAACLAATLSLSLFSVVVVASFHDGTRQFTQSLRAAVAQVQGPDLGSDDRRPVVVTDWYVVGRITAGTGPEVRGLTVLDPTSDLPEITRRLADAGVDQFVFVVDDPVEVDLLGPEYVVDRADPGGDSRFFIAHRRT